MDAGSDSSLKTEITDSVKDKKEVMTLPDNHVCPTCSQNLKVQGVLREEVKKDRQVLN